jgi:hypothetical protein
VAIDRLCSVGLQAYADTVTDLLQSTSCAMAASLALTCHEIFMIDP